MCHDGAVMVAQVNSRQSGSDTVAFTFISDDYYYYLFKIYLNVIYLNLNATLHSICNCDIPK